MLYRNLANATFLLYILAPNLACSARPCNICHSPSPVLILGSRVRCLSSLHIVSWHSFVSWDKVHSLVLEVSGALTHSNIQLILRNTVGDDRTYTDSVRPTLMLPAKKTNNNDYSRVASGYLKFLVQDYILLWQWCIKNKKQFNSYKSNSNWWGCKQVWESGQPPPPISLDCRNLQACWAYWFASHKNQHDGKPASSVQWNFTFRNTGVLLVIVLGHRPSAAA